MYGMYIYIPTHVIRPNTIVFVTNRVPVAPFGLKLGQNESMMMMMMMRMMMMMMMI